MNLNLHKRNKYLNLSLPSGMLYKLNYPKDVSVNFVTCYSHIDLDTAKIAIDVSVNSIIIALGSEVASVNLTMVSFGFSCLLRP